MLHENFNPSLDRAGRAIGVNFDGNLPNEQADWNKFGTDLANEFTEQLKVGDGSGTDNFYCGQGVTYISEGHYTCPPISIQVHQIEYANPAAEQLYQDQTTLDAQNQLNLKQQAVNTSALNAAKAKYGPNAGEILGQLDIIAACTKAKNCTIVQGTNSQVAVPTG
jgi:hypothetical protein